MDGAVVLISDLNPKKRWLYDHGIPQSIHDQLAGKISLLWMAHRPVPPFDQEHVHYLPRTGPERLAAAEKELAPRGSSGAGTILDKLQSALGSMRKPVERDDATYPWTKFDSVVGYDTTIQTLLAILERENAERIAITRDDWPSSTARGVEFALRKATTTNADLLYCPRTEGVLPIVVSKQLLQRWLASEVEPDPRILLRRPAHLARLGRSVEAPIVGTDAFGYVIRTTMADPNEHRLKPFWQARLTRISEAFDQDPDAPGPGRDAMETVLGEYRDAHASGLEAYHAAGTIHDVEDLRSRMMVTNKPLLDYFVTATHFGLFLQRYAGLKPSSRVVDIGCSWGYLGFALANFLSAEGSYLGIEVQKEATEWCQSRLAWLGKNFEFLCLDISNNYYNPHGAVARGNVTLPLPDRSADIVFLSSVFTHMQVDGVQSYLYEFERILKPGGLAAFSYRDTSMYHTGGGAYEVAFKDIPDKITSYSRAKIEDLCSAAGLEEAREPVNFYQFDRTDYQTFYFARPRASATSRVTA